MCSKLRRHNNKSGKMEKSPSGGRGEGKVFFLVSAVTLKVLVQNVQITNTVASEIFFLFQLSRMCAAAPAGSTSHAAYSFQPKFSFLSAEFSAYMEIMLRHWNCFEFSMKNTFPLLKKLLKSFPVKSEENCSKQLTTTSALLFSLSFPARRNFHGSESTKKQQENPRQIIQRVSRWKISIKAKKLRRTENAYRE